uniref:2-keto-4-pentenoate hydratase n=1 Tax=Candidatus Kentrum sp. LFY TaxID=2126342 RepID=A0A450UMI4_9GAMM|nr:MAG: 2-keto-4-pentenoate hydratase [Candidatus Kentron sp. LFY]
MGIHCLSESIPEYPVTSQTHKGMRIMKKLFITIALWLGVMGIAVGDMAPGLADTILRAEVTHDPIPVLSLEYSDMDVDMAYGVQRAYVTKRLDNDTLAGFKAGLTSRKGQRKFGLDAPIAGALFDSGRLTDGAVVQGSGFRRPMVETEIGFIIGTPLPQPVEDTATLRKSIRAIAPVIELPDLGFSKTKRLIGTDIIAANACAKQFIVGDPQPADSVDPNAVDVVLFLDGHEINRGKGREALGDQWRAALWLVNTMIAQGWTLQPGQILLTGALGKMLPAKSGKYRADYGELGEIRFEISVETPRR